MSTMPLTPFTYGLIGHRHPLTTPQTVIIITGAGACCRRLAIRYPSGTLLRAYDYCRPDSWSAVYLLHIGRGTYRGATCIIDDDGIELDFRRDGPVLITMSDVWLRDYIPAAIVDYVLNSE